MPVEQAPAPPPEDQMIPHEPEQIIEQGAEVLPQRAPTEAQDTGVQAQSTDEALPPPPPEPLPPRPDNPMSLAAESRVIKKSWSAGKGTPEDDEIHPVARRDPMPEKPAITMEDRQAPIREARQIRKGRGLWFTQAKAKARSLFARSHQTIQPPEQLESSHQISQPQQPIQESGAQHLPRRQRRVEQQAREFRKQGYAGYMGKGARFTPVPESPFKPGAPKTVDRFDRRHGPSRAPGSPSSDKSEKV